MENRNNRAGSCLRSIGDIFVITVIAAAAGLAAGLLFAPRSGLKTRKVLKKAIDEMIDRSKFAILEARMISGELLEKSIEKAEKISSKARGKK